MHAAVVRDWATAPRYEVFADPITLGEHEEVVEVLASGLHPRVRSQAAGSHYTSTDTLPLIPGIDGVGRRADGTLVYFVLPDTNLGALAEQTVVDARRLVTLPASSDPVVLAAAMNPAMSSWIALRDRLSFTTGESVLIMGATGSAGQLAVQVAKHLGAGEIVVAGRGQARLDLLRALGADRTIDLAGPLEQVAADYAARAAEVDVVLDYLWGPPTELALPALLQARRDRGRLLSWIEIGSVAGPDIALPSAALRQANVHFLGSGQGSASTAGILASLPALVEELSRGSFVIDAVTRPLRDVEAVWGERSQSSGERIVLVP
ncbi:zinc-binding alcohol dehydrogenase family protein [Subtercola sp. RTI3]|uniref:quinone oxidoreductase family protein n=1 Tax=Subtercola sp. RTI3 TaxID=3048639 RepID=UPI002B23D86A|nr:zinc-binding alcohol dehydrogenase family protein [Subtercola sp. RTI3]MEA9984175.1 zinc-binding alcohol dehydrogenase family protein [Subtercola sp. RTI3]